MRYNSIFRRHELCGFRNTKREYEGRIIVKKKWANDDDLIWQVRPDKLNYKLQRRLYGSNDGWEPAEDIYGAQIGRRVLFSSGSTSDIYPLHFGTVTGSSSQANGTYTPYEYRVVECDSAGNVYKNQNEAEFNYKWNSYIDKYSISDNELMANDNQYIARSCLFEPVKGSSHAQMKAIIKNEYTPITHTMKKTWIDDNDYYNSRGSKYKYHLQRYLEGVDDSDSDNIQWKDLNVEHTSPALAEFPLKYNNNQYRNLGGKNYTEYCSDYDVVKNSMEVSNADTHEVMSGHTDNSYQEHLFENLPLYDSQGRKYYYRVIEDFIGSEDYPVETTHHYDFGNNLTKTTLGTNNYYVTDGRSGSVTDSDTVTNITNELVPRMDYVHIDAVKNWDDNNNQDGIRPNEVYFRLTQTYNDNQHSAQQTYSYKSANCDNGWKVRWEQCPAFTNDGKLYSYTVDEVVKSGEDYQVVHYTNPQSPGGNGEITGYTTEFNEKIDIPETINGEKINVHVEPFTNSHTPEKQNLTVKKEWDDSNNANGLRPAKVKYELYCKYHQFPSFNKIKK